MSLESWLEERFGLEVPKPGLARIKEAIDLLELSFEGKKIVTIGGTNGKGQASREFYHHAHKSLKAALWTSPHIVSVTERFVINGSPVESSKLQETFNFVYKTLSEKNLKLSYYEFLFACFLRLSRNCELLVLEVGLGGRFDAVNALDAELVLLTSIGRDHQEYLGDRLEGILVEKFQLARKYRKLFTAFELSYLQNKCAKLVAGLGCDWEDLFLTGDLAKKNNFSERNLALAHRGLREFFGSRDFKASSGPFIKFSFEGAECHSVGAHNPDGMRKCVQFLKDGKYTSSYKLILMSLSKRDLSDGLSMLKAVLSWTEGGNAPLALTGFDHPKAMERQKLSQLVELINQTDQRQKIKFFNDAKEALQLCPPKSQHEPILVLGSNYFIGSLAKASSISRR